MTASDTKKQALRVLVVDDEELVRDFLSDFLLSRGHDAVVAVDGKDALQKLEDYAPDVVISDICMPGMDGVELLGKIRQRENPPPVILLTGFGDLQSAVEALRKGAHDYMLKPVNAEELANRLSHILRVRELEAEAAEERRRSMLVARLAAVGRLAAGVAHEINNPTTYLRGNAQILRALLKRLQDALDSDDAGRLEIAVNALEEQMNELLDGIEDGTERIKRITHALSCFADSQMFEPRSDGCINTCVQDALFLLGEKDGAPAVDLVLEKDIPLIKISRRGITQAALCIIDNAFHAVESNREGLVRITTKSLADNSVRLMVEDSGHGISPADRERVFEPFYTTREVNEGAGLGLSVAYGIIKGDHGGTVSISDSSLGGACLTVDLPVGIEEDELLENYSEPARELA